MRVLILLVLAAGIGWFTFRSLGSDSQGSDAAESRAAASETAAAGQDPAVGTPESAADLSAPAPAPAAAEPNLVEATGEVAAASPAEPARASAVSVPDPGAEPAAAAALLVDPPHFAAWVAEHGGSLPPGRRELASAYGHALAGRPAEARAAAERAGAAAEPAEIELALRIAEPSAALPVTAASPLAMAASMAAIDAQARAAYAEGRHADAARSLSALLLAEIAAPWTADSERLARWSARLAEAQRGHRWNPRGSWASVSVKVEPGDSLTSVRKRAIAKDSSLLACTGQIARANQLKGDMIHPGQSLLVPVDRARMLVDLDAHWAFYMFGDEVAAAWPVGVGAGGTATRPGTYATGEKTKDPMWFPKGKPPVPHGDPENPLGTRWIEWVDAQGRDTGLGFHGTNEPESVGRDASQGCVRMRDADVEELYEILPRGAEVIVQP